MEKIEYYIQYASIFFLVQLLVNISGLLSLVRFFFLSLKYACFKMYAWNSLLTVFLINLMSSFKNSSNIYLISKLAKAYIVQGLVGTCEKIPNSASDKVIKYGKFEFIPLISFHDEFFIT